MSYLPIGNYSISSTIENTKAQAVHKYPLPKETRISKFTCKKKKKELN